MVAEALLERERIFPGWNQTTTTKKATTTKTLSSLMYKDGGSCDRKCGGYSGGCWCDAICHQYKDCCHDKCAFCSDHAMWGSTNYCLVPPDGVCQDNCYTPMPPPKPKPMPNIPKPSPKPYYMPMPSPGPTDFPSGDLPSGDFPSGDYVQPVRKTQVKAANALQPEPTVAA